MKLCNLNSFFCNLSLLTLIFIVSCSNGSKGLDRNLDLSSVEDYQESLTLALDEASEVERQVLTPYYGLTGLGSELTLEHYLFADLDSLNGPNDPFEKARWVEGMKQKRVDSEKTSLRNIFIKLIKEDIAEVEKKIAVTLPSFEKIKAHNEEKALEALFIADTQEEISESGRIEYSRELIITNNSSFDIDRCDVRVKLLGTGEVSPETDISSEIITIRSDTKSCTPLKAGDKLSLLINFTFSAGADTEYISRAVSAGKSISIDFQDQEHSIEHSFEGYSEAYRDVQYASTLEEGINYKKKVLATIQGGN